MLSRLGVVTDRGTLSVAGELLFAGLRDRSCELTYVYRRTSSGELVVNER